ncbi:MAG TPA: hypothetical protein VM536_10800 [Chloroflexia bacterium]|nr:hypothetical protein [Chloroflexia bacterium]
MFEQQTRIASENLARAVDRRTFLKRASQAGFAGMLALATGQAFPRRASAASGTKPPIPNPTISCSPPGPYCNTGGGDLSGCHGAHCFQHLYQGVVVQCRVFYIYQAGCWTTASGGGYWTCCDCECFNAGGTRVGSCGCAQFSSNPVPLPSGPGEKQA